MPIWMDFLNSNLRLTSIHVITQALLVVLDLLRIFIEPSHIALSVISRTSVARHLSILFLTSSTYPKVLSHQLKLTEEASEYRLYLLEEHQRAGCAVDSGTISFLTFT